MGLLVVYGIIFLTVFSVIYGEPQYEVQVRLPVGMFFISGSVNQFADGSCCSPDELPQTGGCFSPCLNNQIRIRLCFREAEHSANDTDPNNCPLGGKTFTLEEDSDTGTIVHFESNATSTNSTTYPGRYQLFFEVVYTVQPQRQIGSGSKVFNHSIQVQDTFISPVTVPIENLALQISGVRVVCRENFFGPDCNCSPRDDSTGHFTCATDGTKLCLSGYQNPETNCTDLELESATGVNTHMSTTGANEAASSAPQATASIAVGTSVGVFVILFAVLLIAVVLVSQHKRRKVKRGDGKIVFTTFGMTRTVTKADPEESQSNMYSSNDDSSSPVYATVNRKNYTQEIEEVLPPISPYIEPVSFKQMSDALSTELHHTGFPTLKSTSQDRIQYADINVARAHFNAQSSIFGNTNDTNQDDVQYVDIRS